MKDNSGKILLALLAGASAGVVAGLLMAPDTGEATRTSVKKWANKLSTDLEKNLQTGLDEIKNMSSGVIDTLNKKASAVNGSVGDAVKSAADSVTGAGSTGSSTGSSSTGSSSTGSSTGAGSKPGGAV
ncbi:YtxH domain-containing protein [Pontibacter qinzhouensis]|uniref:YtxH domain-containing protein n=1 Tax=Pontibacter qinzhouensis TaxID=2603253 RepID=A0A5C8KCR5_9BACT|nr:YtxH domain-containing protein [Pontibacter qinzhouensis]TXK52083.1 YtxH domain-containing protein [Pontibacter qinzhouensis]